MAIDNATYPLILLPFRLRMRFFGNRVIRFATFSASEEVEINLIALERKFQSLILRENNTISKICFSYSNSVAEYDDLRQDALINIWRGLRNFRSESSEKTWIYRVTVNSCLSTSRKQSRYQHESLEGLYDMVESDDSGKEAIEQLHRTISSLNPQEKAIIMMWLDELTYDEIALAMGYNRNTVATKIKRIKEKITKEYRQTYE